MVSHAVVTLIAFARLLTGCHHGLGFGPLVFVRRVGLLGIPPFEDMTPFNGPLSIFVATCAFSTGGIPPRNPTYIEPSTRSCSGLRALLVGELRWSRSSMHPGLQVAISLSSNVGASNTCYRSSTIIISIVTIITIIVIILINKY